MTHQHPLVFLHGALGNHRQMNGLVTSAEGDFLVLAPDFPGHGRDADDHELTIDHLVEYLKSYLASLPTKGAFIFGYSMGGYVASLCAARYPHLIAEIVTYGTKWQWSPEIATKEVAMLDAEKIMAKVPAYGQHLENLHTGRGWKSLLQATAHMMLGLGRHHETLQTEMSSLRCPVLILRGSMDKMVNREESMDMVTRMSKAVYSEIPDLPHNIEQVNPALLFEEIRKAGFWSGNEERVF